MELKQNVKVHNKFEITVCDAKTGKEKQKAYAYNVVLDNFFQLRLKQRSGNVFHQAMNTIAIGTGTGTPSITDTDLFKPLTRRTATKVDEHYEYPTSYITKQIKINADECNGETFTEVGLEVEYSNGSRTIYILCTHAMLQDADGKPTTVHKTDTDVVYINATFYCIFVKGGFGDNGIYPLPKDNMIIKYLVDGEDGLYVYSSRFPHENASEIEIDHTHEKAFSFRDFTADYANLTIDLPEMTIHDNEFNNHIVKNIVLKGLGGFQFPDPSIFPDYEIDHLALGEGDGETTEFDIKCPLIKNGTAKIYVGGRELSPSEYEVDYESNCCDNRENYYTANMKMDGVHAKFGNALTGSPDKRHKGQDPLYWGIDPLQQNIYPSTTSISVDRPIWIDLGDAKQCNTVKIDTRPDFAANAKIVIEHSDNNVDWTPVSYTTNENKYNGGYTYYTFRFPLTAARYWRVYPKTSEYYYFEYSSSLGTRDGSNLTSATFFLGKSVPGLKLHTAPKVGEKVEASYKIDVPYKTENNIIRLTCSIVLQRD